VRRALVSPDQFTGRTQRCISFGGKVEVFPLARVNVDTPFYSGILECCVIDRPVADLIIGNLPGVVDDVLKSTSCTAVQSSLLKGKECTDVVSQGDEVSLDGECVTAHEKSLAAPEHPVSTPHSSCSEPTPSPDTLVTGDVSVVSVCHDDMIPAEIENGGANSQLPDSVLRDVVTNYKGCADSGHSSAFSAPDSAVSASSTDPVQAALVTTRLQARKEKAEMKPLVTAFPPELNVTRDDLERLQREDAALKPLFARVGQVEENRVSFVIADGILYRHFAGDEEVVKQIVVPGPLRSAVLCAAHDGIMAGHCGVRRTLRRVLLRFYWPGVRCAVKDYCQTCDICQKIISKGRVAPVPLQQMPVVDVPFKRIAVDLVGPISPCSDRGHKYILTVVDVATRFPEAVPLMNIDTVSVAEALVTLFNRVGCPDKILSDSQPHTATLVVSQGACSHTESYDTITNDWSGLPFQDELIITPDPEVYLPSSFRFGETDPTPVTAPVAATGVVTDEESDGLDKYQFHTATVSESTLPTFDGGTSDDILCDLALSLPQHSQRSEPFQLCEDMFADQSSCLQIMCHFLLLFLFSQSVLWKQTGRAIEEGCFVSSHFVKADGQSHRGEMILSDPP